MATVLAGKRMVFGVCGGIAAFKTAGWVSSLRKEDARVTVVMTAAGSRFVSPLTFAVLSGNQVYTDMFDLRTVDRIPHISLAREADCIMVAPATAHTIARLANGMADDLLSAVILATRAPVLLCPAMNGRMYEHPATRNNIARVKSYGYQVVEPACGSMACGEKGPGRLPSWDCVREQLLALFSPRDLLGQTVVVTAGPTREPLDPARYLSNRSSGRMGYALAQTARRRGAEVVLISGPTALPPPPGIETIRVTTATEMRDAVMDHCRQATVIVKAAAVADFRPARSAEHKMKKNAAVLSLDLTANVDILSQLGDRKKQAGGPLLVGFAAESCDHLAEGRRKLREKNLDLMVVNDILGSDTGFESSTNRVVLLDRNGGEEELPLLAKEEVADRIWGRVVGLLYK